MFFRLLSFFGKTPYSLPLKSYFLRIIRSWVKRMEEMKRLLKSIFPMGLTKSEGDSGLSIWTCCFSLFCQSLIEVDLGGVVGGYRCHIHWAVCLVFSKSYCQRSPAIVWWPTIGHGWSLSVCWTAKVTGGLPKLEPKVTQVLLLKLRVTLPKWYEEIEMMRICWSSVCRRRFVYQSGGIRNSVSRLMSVCGSCISFQTHVRVPFFLCI